MILSTIHSHTYTFILETCDNYSRLVFNRWEKEERRCYSQIEDCHTTKWTSIYKYSFFSTFSHFFSSTFACWTKKKEKGILIKTSQWMVVRKFICMNNSRSCVRVLYSIQLLVPHWLIFRSCSIAQFDTQTEWTRLLRILTNDHDATNTHYSNKLITLLFLHLLFFNKFRWKMIRSNIRHVSCRRSHPISTKIFFEELCLFL
jgi:hypothetical protein